MPFTASHPAAVIPLARRGWVFSALVVGSMSPDFEYFLRLSTKAHFGHTIFGLFLFCLPVSLIVLWIFHALLKWPLLSLLPSNHQERVMSVATRFRFGPARQFQWIIASVLIGAITHLVWDSMTHLQGWGVQHFSFLQATVLHTAYGDIALYKVLQHGSTLAGLTVITGSYWHWWRHAPKAERAFPSPLTLRSKSAVILSIGIVAGGMGSAYGLHCAGPISGFDSFRTFVSRTVVAASALGLVGLVIFSLWWRVFRRAAVSGEFRAEA